LNSATANFVCGMLACSCEIRSFASRVASAIAAPMLPVVSSASRTSAFGGSAFRCSVDATVVELPLPSVTVAAGGLIPSGVAVSARAAPPTPPTTVSTAAAMATSAKRRITTETPLSAADAK
jgi:hypothetical protein